MKNRYFLGLSKFRKRIFNSPGKYYLAVAFVIFIFEVFLRFYQIDIKNPFGYDQVDNAWAAKNIIVNHWYPLVGVVVKQNSGVHLGPVYYYMLTVFYWMLNLNPISSGVFAGFTSIFTFLSLFYIVKKLFSWEVALIAVFINTFSITEIISDRVQWNVGFLPAISLIIFYLLYKVTLGEPKKLIPLTIVIGFGLSIHFTVVFFLIILFLSLPFFPRTKETVKYFLISTPIFLIWLSPNIIYGFIHKSYNSSAVSYFLANYHGFHLRRMIQLTGDAFIQFNHYFLLDKIFSLKFLLVPLFFAIYLYKSFSRNKLIFCYLVFLWFVVPWVIFTAYSGELSDYYFSINRFIALFIISYLIHSFWKLKIVFAKVIVVILLGAYGMYNFINFLPYKDTVNLHEVEKKAKKAIDEGRRIEFQEGVPETYLYYYYMRQKGKDVY